MAPQGRISNGFGVDKGMVVPVLMSVLLAGTVEAAELRVLSPASGEELRRDQIELDVEVLGEPLTSYAVHVNGDQATVVVLTDDAGRGVGGGTVDIFPLMRARVGHGSGDGAAPDLHYRTLALEMWGPVDGVWSSQPLARERVSLVDLRDWDDDVDPLLDPDQVLIDGLAVGLTAEGLATLEAPLVAELPAAPLRAFDSVLAEVVGQGVAAGGTDLAPGTCVPLDETPLSLQAWLAPEIATLLGHAATVPVCKRALDLSAVGAWQAAVVAYGYEIRPTLGSRSDLAICVEGLDATLVDLWTEGHAVGLEADDDRVLVETWHLGPAGRVDVALDAWLVYKGGAYEAGPCGVVQAERVPQDLAICPDLPVGAELAGGPPVSLGLAPDLSGYGLDADQEDPSESSLWDAWVDPVQDALCGHPVLAEPVASMVESVGPTAAVLLDSAWDAGAPDATQLSSGLEALLASWSLGVHDEGPVRVDAELTELVELRADPMDWEAPQGLVAFYDTVAEPQEPWPLNQAPVFAPEVVPWPDTGALSWWGTPIDARIAVSTGAVNQVLAAAAQTDVLAREVDLTGLDLGNLLPELAGRELVGRLTWRLAPVVTMVPGDVEGDDALMLHLAGVELVVHPGGHPDQALVVVAIEGVDGAFELALGETDGALEADLVLASLTLTVVRHELSRWPEEQRLVEALEVGLEAALVAGIQDAVAMLPVPEFQGLVAPVSLVEVEAPYQSGDVVLLSVGFEDMAHTGP